MHFSLQKITITNFKAVRGTLALDFTKVIPGLYFVRGINELETKLGSNGSGKSTVFVESVLWVLTGKTARSNRPGDDIENWATNKETTKVAVDFSLGNVFYSVVRTRNPNSLLLDERKIEQQELDKLLPLTDSALRRSILLDQFGDLFLSLRPEDKSRIFSETLNLDLWIRASNKAGEEVSGLEKDIAKEENYIASTIGLLNEANSQFEQLFAKEEAFEGELKEELALKRMILADARVSAQEATAALGKTREGWKAVERFGNAAIKANNLRALLKQRQQALVDAKALNQNIGDEIERLEGIVEKYLKSDKTCPECGQVVTDQHIKDKLVEAEAALQRAEDRFRQSDSSVAIARQIYDDLNREIQELEQGLIEYNEVQSILTIAAEKSLTADKEVHRLTKELDGLKNKKNPFTEQCDSLEKRIKDLSKQKKAIQFAINTYNQNLELCKFWQRGFKEIRLEQIDSCLLELEISANRHMESLGLEDWEIKFSVERETKQGNISHGFSVFLYPPGRNDAVPFESYSGGETQRLQLAVAFGLSEVLLSRSGLTTDFEILDEPTTHLSPEGVDDLLACLRDRALELNRRIIIIDQLALDRAAFDGVVTIRKTKDGVLLDDNGLLMSEAVKEKKKERVRL